MLGDLAERILTEEQFQLIIALEEDLRYPAPHLRKRRPRPRNRASARALDVGAPYIVCKLEHIPQESEETVRVVDPFEFLRSPFVSCYPVTKPTGRALPQVGFGLFYFINHIQQIHDYPEYYQS